MPLVMLLQESEGEDAETSRVVLPAAAAGRASRALVGRQSRVRLHEVGPRLELEIVKVGGCGNLGPAPAHAHVCWACGLSELAPVFASWEVMHLSVRK